MEWSLLEWPDKAILIAVGINLSALIADIILKFKFSPQEKRAMGEQIKAMEKQIDTLKLTQAPNYIENMEALQAILRDAKAGTDEVSKELDKVKEKLKSITREREILRDVNRAKSRLLDQLNRADKQIVNMSGVIQVGSVVRGHIAAKDSETNIDTTVAGANDPK